MHRFITITLTICILLLGANLAMAAPKGPGNMRLAPPQGMQATKSPVAFSHARHGAANIECATCHHTGNGKGKMQQCATAGCHDQPGKKDIRAYYSAFHAKKTDRSCLGCHKIMKQQGRNVPVSCGVCHPK